MEQYLIDQYNVICNDEWLTSTDEIVEYFKEIGSDYLECGQGFYTDNTKLLVAINDKFYSVTITAAIVSSKQDCGDRLYHVDYIKDVTYIEVPKPLPKNSSDMIIVIEKFNHEKAIKLLSEHNIKFTVR